MKKKLTSTPRWMDRFQTQFEMQLRTLLLPCSYKPLQEPSRLYNAEINGVSYKTFTSNIFINRKKFKKSSAQFNYMGNRSKYSSKLFVVAFKSFQYIKVYLKRTLINEDNIDNKQCHALKRIH